MNENMFKRAWLSTKRKPGRSIILALIFCAMGSLVLAAIIIKSAVNESMDYAKSSIESTVALQADMTTIRDAMGRQGQDRGNGAAGEMVGDFTPGQVFARPAVQRSVADEIAKSTYVKDYTYSITTSAKNDDLVVVETTQDGFGGGKTMRGFGRLDGTTTESGDFTINGVNAYAYIDAVKSGQMELVEGDYFNEEDENAVVISVDFAEANDLEIGDTLKLINVYNNKNYSLKVTGIYDNSSNFFDPNTIYTNIDTAKNFLDPDKVVDGDFAVDNVSYILSDNDQATEFIAWIGESFPELAENNIVAVEDTSLYEQMVGPIESVGGFATVILVIVIVTSAIIITLIVVINVKDRRYEMGVLLSLGASKATIIGQFFIELAIVGTIAFVVSCFSATVMAGAMGQGILNSQLASMTKEAENNFGRPTSPIGGKGGSEMGGGKMVAMQQPEGQIGITDDTITEINVNAKASDYILLFICGYLVMLVALVLPAISVMRYQPKQILQGKE